MIAVDPGDPEQTVWRLADPDWEPVALAAGLTDVLLRAAVADAAAGAPVVADAVSRDRGCYSGLEPIVWLPSGERPSAYTDGVCLVSVLSETPDQIVALIGGPTVEAVHEVARERFSLEGWFYDVPVQDPAVEGFDGAA